MQTALINNGRDLHLQHGPIDLIISASGPRSAVSNARDAARKRFASILSELVAELPCLKQPVSDYCNVKGSVARRMWQAASNYGDDGFITPMIAVAGAVADEVLLAVIDSVQDLRKFSVNNGGDIAFWHADGESSVIGVADPLCGQLIARASVSSAQSIGGVATSGRHGRSMSLGIADSITVLANNAVMADAAATLIANAVNLPDNVNVQRVLAEALDPDSDMRGNLVTVGVSALTQAEKSQALQAGLAVAQRFKQRRHIVDACLFLQGQSVTTDAFEAVAQLSNVQTINRKDANA